MSKIEDMTDEQLSKQARIARVKIYSVMFTILLPITLLAFLTIGLEKAVELADRVADWFGKQVSKIGPVVLHERGPFKFVNRLTREANLYHAEQAQRARRKRDEDHLDPTALPDGKYE